MTQIEVDQVVLGAGLFGLFGAELAGRLGRSVAIVDPEPVPMARASFANQARLHRGYHYPRSVGTALQAIAYRDRFAREFADCLNGSFEKIYAIARFETMTGAEGFERFCRSVEIPVERVDVRTWFRPGTVVAAFRCEEPAFDAGRVRTAIRTRLERLAPLWRLQRRVVEVERTADAFALTLDDGEVLVTPRVLNATYAATNQVLELFDVEPLPLTYELCELALGRPSPQLAPYGVTVMDGPFFSVMPFGRTGLHSLSAVDYTPHARCDGPMPTFPCQRASATCSAEALDNCSTCAVRPPSLSAEMLQLASRYLLPELTLEVERAVMAIRPVLRTSTVDDSRPTNVYRHRSNPELVTVLSGKINTIYDLEQLW